MADVPSPSGDGRVTARQEDNSPQGGTDPAPGPASGDLPAAGFWIRSGALLIDISLFFLVESAIGLILLLRDPAYSQLVPLVDFSFFLSVLFYLFYSAIGFSLLIVVALVSDPQPLSWIASLPLSLAPVPLDLPRTTAVPLFVLLTLLPIPLYFSVLESSAWQATIGKRLLQLVVTDRYGKRISFPRSLGRYFAKWLYLVPLGIGFLGFAFGVMGAETNLQLAMMCILLGVSILVAGFTGCRRGFHDMLAGTRVSRRPRVIVW
ncbi:MAG: RDD family protein [Methanomicrobiales archaeon]|nr:RDD family protein [Methanomicrobiales archaeon]